MKRILLLLLFSMGLIQAQPFYPLPVMVNGGGSGGGGGGTPGGSNGQFQFNNSGAFGGTPGLTLNTGTMTFDLTTGYIFNSDSGSTFNFNGTLGGSAFGTGVVTAIANTAGAANGILVANSSGTLSPSDNTAYQPETMTYYQNILNNSSDISAFDLQAVDKLVVDLKACGAWSLITEIYPLCGKDYLAALTKLKWDNSGNSYAKNYLNFTNMSPTANDTITIGSTTYTFVSGSPSSGQYQVTISATSNTANSIVNLVNCINNSGGTAGTDYSSGGSANASVTAKYTYNGQSTFFECDVRAITSGSAGSAVSVGKTCSIAQWANASTTLIFGIDSPYLQLVNISSGSPFQTIWYDSVRGFTFPNVSHNSQGNFITSDYDPSTNSSTLNQGNNCLGVAFTSEQSSGQSAYDDVAIGTEKWYVSNTGMGNFNLACQQFANGNGIFIENQTSTSVTYVNTEMPLTVGTGSYASTALNPGTFLFNRSPNTTTSNGGYASGQGTSYGFAFTGAGLTSTLMVQQASLAIDKFLTTLGRLGPVSQRALYIGDSTTQGTAGTGEAIYPREVCYAFNLQAINAGVPNEAFLNSSSPNSRILNLFNITTMPPYIFLQEGINDIRVDGATSGQWGAPAKVANYGAAMTTWINDCIQFAWANGTPLPFSRNPKLIISSPFWTYFDNVNTQHAGNTTAGSLQGQSYANGRLEQYSAQIATDVISGTQGVGTGNSLVKFADCYHLFEDAPNNYINATSYFSHGSPFSGDGLHPNNAGYTLCGQQIIRTMNGIAYRNPLVTFPSSGAIALGATSTGQVVSFTGGNPYTPTGTPGSTGSGNLTNNIVMYGVKVGQVVTLGLPQSPVISLSGISTNGNTTLDVFTKTAHGLQVGEQVTLAGFTTDTLANGYWYVGTVPSSSTFTLVDASGASFKGASAETSASQTLVTGIPAGLIWQGSVVQSDNGVAPGLVNITAFNPQIAAGANVNPVYISISVKNP